MITVNNLYKMLEQMKRVFFVEEFSNVLESKSSRIERPTSGEIKRGALRELHLSDYKYNDPYSAFCFHLEIEKGKNLLFRSR